MNKVCCGTEREPVVASADPVTTSEYWLKHTQIALAYAGQCKRRKCRQFCLEVARITQRTAEGLIYNGR